MTDCRTGCTRPVSDGASICRFCVDEIERALTDRIPSLAAELEIVAARQTRYGTRVGSRSTEHALPFEPKAAEQLAALKNMLSTWVRVFQEG
jgi:hypothetical protein